jgi:hypothetical protein
MSDDVRVRAIVAGKKAWANLRFGCRMDEVVTASMAEAVDALWRTHGGTFGPSTSAASRARAKGWESPMA